MLKMETKNKEQSEPEKTIISIGFKSFSEENIDEIQANHPENGATIILDDCEYILFPDSEVAGAEARNYWENLAKDDPEEFTSIVGKDNLVKWCLGQLAGPGSTHVTSLSAWLDLWLSIPEQHFASYDSDEQEVYDVSNSLIQKLGFIPTVAYRSN